MDGYKVVNIQLYGDFDMLQSNTILVAPTSLDIKGLVKTFQGSHEKWFRPDEEIDGKYIAVKYKKDDLEVIKSLVKFLLQYGCSTVKVAEITLGD